MNLYDLMKSTLIIQEKVIPESEDHDVVISANIIDNNYYDLHVTLITTGYCLSSY